MTFMRVLWADRGRYADGWKLSGEWRESHSVGLWAWFERKQ